MPILVSYFRLLGAKTRRTLSSKDVLGGENLAVNSHYLDYNALKKNIFTIFSLMFMVCFSIFRFITQYRTNTLESFLLFCKKKSVMMQKHRCRKKSHLQSNNAPTSRLLTAERRSSQNICFRSDHDHTWMQRYILQSETSYSDHSLQPFERKAQHSPEPFKTSNVLIQAKIMFSIGPCYNIMQA